MPFSGWGGYAADGLLITCGYDFLSQVALSTWWPYWTNPRVCVLQGKEEFRKKIDNMSSWYHNVIISNCKSCTVHSLGNT
jgi:hypothetical protein